MAPADTLSPPGSASYSSDTMNVGDGTWDFTKNTFLLPNLVGLNFETMRYNGMGNRFATLTQYHSLVKAHGVIAVITFLFIVPIAIMMARFYRRRPGFAIRYHAYLQILAVGLSTVVFVLGFFAVGPKRSLSNPHHGIGVAIYTLILLQVVGGRLVKNIRGRSLRVMIHQWSGRAIAILGIVQVPLGLALYGSPKFTFILFALWMAFLVLLYFILDYRAWDRPDYVIRGGRSEAGRTEYTERTERKSGGGMMRWLGPLAAGAGAFALLRGRRNRDRSRSRNRSQSRSRALSRHRSRSRGPEVIASRRGSESYVEDEKFSERPRKSGGFMNKVLGAGAALGAGALISNFMGRRNQRRRDDEEYSAVETDTPSRRHRSRSHRRHDPVISEVSEESEEFHRDGRRTPLLPGPGGPPAMAAAISAAERPAARPMTPRPSHRRGDSRIDSVDESDYSSYVSPSRRGGKSGETSGGVGKGILAGLGLGWFAKRMKDRRDQREQHRLREEEDERRSGHRGSRFTGDGYSTPTRRESRRRIHRPVPSRVETGTSISRVTEGEGSSLIEPRPGTSAFSGPPMPPLPAGGYPPGAPLPPGVIPVPAGGAHSRSRSRSRHDVGPAVMPPMPPDPQGILAHESGSEAYTSSGGRPHRRHSSRRRREGEAAAATAAATAGMLAAEEEARRRTDRGGSRTPSQPVSVKVKVHDDRDRNVTLRRLTEEEAAAARRDRRRRADSASSLSGTDSPTRRRYRRDSSQRRAEEAAEHAVTDDERLAPLSPPAPAFAGGRRPAKDSAYYSGQPGPSGSTPAAGATVSSLGSHGTWSGASPSPSARFDPTASAAERRRRRRLERRDAPPAGTVDFT